LRFPRCTRDDPVTSPGCAEAAAETEAAEAEAADDGDVAVVAVLVAESAATSRDSQDLGRRWPRAVSARAGAAADLLPQAEALPFPRCARADLGAPPGWSWAKAKAEAARRCTRADLCASLLRGRGLAVLVSSMFLGCRGGGQGRARLCSSMFASGRVGSRGRAKLLSSMFAVTASSMFVGQGDAAAEAAVDCAACAIPVAESAATSRGSQDLGRRWLRAASSGPGAAADV
jgi:hypothetical protein